MTGPGDLSFHDLGLFFTHVVDKMGDKRGENPTALRAAVFPLSANKN